jgi:hypothetical protein
LEQKEKNKMRTPDEIKIGETTLDEIIKLHRKYVYGEDGGVRANLSRANLSGANLSDANLSDANLNDADLSGANLNDANLSRADLSGANLSRADLRSADLSGANLSRADLRSADLSGANLSRADLRSADLSGANLSRADLRSAEDIIALGPIGSRGDFIFGVRHEKAIMIKTGCFWGTISEFKNDVKKTHNDNEYAQVYAAAIVFIRKYFAVKS